MDRLTEIRERLGYSAALWSSLGEHHVTPQSWSALSGAVSVDQNLFVCYGSDPAIVSASVAKVTESKCRALIALAGPGLDSAQVLIDEGWICVGSVPIMVLNVMPEVNFSVDPQVKEAGAEDLPRIWDALSEAYGMEPSLARVAVPAHLFDTEGQRVWTLSVEDDVRCCVATVVVDDSVMIWSMATRPHWQHHGYGRRLLCAVLGQVAIGGATNSILYSSPAGEPLYRSLGYDVAEHWQLWSRPRWVIGRS